MRGVRLELNNSEGACGRKGGCAVAGDSGEKDSSEMNQAERGCGGSNSENDDLLDRK